MVMSETSELSTVITVSEGGLEVKVCSEKGQKVKLHKSLFGLTISSENNDSKHSSKLADVGSSASIISVVQAWFGW